MTAAGEAGRLAVGEVEVEAALDVWFTRPDWREAYADGPPVRDYMRRSLAAAAAARPAPAAEGPEVERLRGEVERLQRLLDGAKVAGRLARLRRNSAETTLAAARGEIARLTDRSEELADVLAGLSSYLGAGFPDDPDTISSDAFNDRVRWGIDSLTEPLTKMVDAARQCAQAAEAEMLKERRRATSAETALAAARAALRAADAAITDLCFTVGIIARGNARGIADFDRRADALRKALAEAADPASHDRSAS